jgi:hypothetical protein
VKNKEVTALGPPKFAGKNRQLKLMLRLQKIKNKVSKTYLKLQLTSQDALCQIAAFMNLKKIFLVHTVSQTIH